MASSFRMYSSRTSVRQAYLFSAQFSSKHRLSCSSSSQYSTRHSSINHTFPTTPFSQISGFPFHFSSSNSPSSHQLLTFASFSTSFPKKPDETIPTSLRSKNVPWQSLSDGAVDREDVSSDEVNSDEASNDEEYNDEVNSSEEYNDEIDDGEENNDAVSGGEEYSDEVDDDSEQGGELDADEEPSTEEVTLDTFEEAYPTVEDRREVLLEYIRNLPLPAEEEQKMLQKHYGGRGKSATEYEDSGGEEEESSTFEFPHNLEERLRLRDEKWGNYPINPVSDLTDVRGKPLYGEIPIPSSPSVPRDLEAETKALRNSIAKRAKSKLKFDRPWDDVPEIVFGQSRTVLKTEWNRILYKYLALRRIVRMELHLNRALRIERPKKRQLLMLLNEFESANRNINVLHEKYIGPVRTFDEILHDPDVQSALRGDYYTPLWSEAEVAAGAAAERSEGDDDAAKPLEGSDAEELKVDEETSEVNAKEQGAHDSEKEPGELAEATEHLGEHPKDESLISKWTSAIDKRIEQQIDSDDTDSGVEFGDEVLYGDPQNLSDIREMNEIWDKETDHEVRRDIMQEESYPDIDLKDLPPELQEVGKKLSGNPNLTSEQLTSLVRSLMDESQRIDQQYEQSTPMRMTVELLSDLKQHFQALNIHMKERIYDRLLKIIFEKSREKMKRIRLDHAVAVQEMKAAELDLLASVADSNHNDNSLSKAKLNEAINGMRLHVEKLEEQLNSADASSFPFSFAECLKYAGLSNDELTLVEERLADPEKPHEKALHINGGNAPEEAEILDKKGKLNLSRNERSLIESNKLLQWYKNKSPEEQSKFNEELAAMEKLIPEAIDNDLEPELSVPLLRRADRAFAKLKDEEKEAVTFAARVNRVKVHSDILNNDILMETEYETLLPNDEPEFDPLNQFMVDEEDPKHYNGIEKAFAHVNRYSIDPRTDAEIVEDRKKRVVPRLAPDSKTHRQQYEDLHYILFAKSPDAEQQRIALGFPADSMEAEELDELEESDDIDEQYSLIQRWLTERAERDTAQTSSTSKSTPQSIGSEPSGKLTYRLDNASAAKLSNVSGSSRPGVTSANTTIGNRTTNNASEFSNPGELVDESRVVRTPGKDWHKYTEAEIRRMDENMVNATFMRLKDHLAVEAEEPTTAIDVEKLKIAEQTEGNSTALRRTVNNLLILRDQYAEWLNVQYLLETRGNLEESEESEETPEDGEEEVIDPNIIEPRFEELEYMNMVVDKDGDFSLNWRASQVPEDGDFTDYHFNIPGTNWPKGYKPTIQELDAAIFGYAWLLEYEDGMEWMNRGLADPENHSLDQKRDSGNDVFHTEVAANKWFASQSTELVPIPYRPYHRMAKTLKESLSLGKIDNEEYDYQMRLLAKRISNVDPDPPTKVDEEESNERKSDGEAGNSRERADLGENEDKEKKEEQEPDPTHPNPRVFNPYGQELYENGLFRIAGPLAHVEPRWFRMQYRLDDLRARYLDSDPTPATVHEFDFNYFHFDEEDYEFLKRLDPLADFHHVFRKPMTTEIVYRKPDGTQEDSELFYLREAVRGQHVLMHTTRKAIYHLHKNDPVRWTPTTLGQKFRISRDHARGIILLEAAHERSIDMNMTRSNDPVIMTAEEEMERDYERMELHWKYVKAGERVLEENKSFLEDALDEEFPETKGQEVDLDDSPDDYHPDYFPDMHPAEPDYIESPMLHMLPRLARPAIPDIRFIQENDVKAIEDIEREKEERFLSHQERQAKRESEKYAKLGSMGTEPEMLANRKGHIEGPPTSETIPSGKLLPPIPYHITLTDITQMPSARFAIAVRDATGVLRTPTPHEFVRVRRREKNDKSKFIYMQYRPPSHALI